jgi:hypothetical protein
MEASIMDKLIDIQKMLEGFKKDCRMYWIKALVKDGDISEAEAGYLVYINKLL